MLLDFLYGFVVTERRADEKAMIRNRCSAMPDEVLLKRWNWVHLPAIWGWDTLFSI